MTDEIQDSSNPTIGRARSALYRRLLDVVAMPSVRVPAQDRNMVGDILLDMLFHADERERIMCAGRLRESRDAPRRLLRYLAQCSFVIAKPIIEQNEGLCGNDLIEICELGTVEHRMAVAGRKVVEGTVSTHLAEHAEPHILKILINNRGAELPEQAIDALVQKSRDVDSMCALLVERLEVKPAQAMAMFWWSDGPTRRKILQRHSADRTEVIDLCSDVYEMAAAEQWADPVARKALQMIERRQRNRAALDKSEYDSLEEAVNAAATEGMNATVAQEIGYLAGVKPVTIAKLMSDKGGEGLAVLVKATGLHRDFLAVLWAALRRPAEIEDGVPHPQFALVRETYEILTVAKAQTTLRYWNWSLSSAFSPRSTNGVGTSTEPANQDSEFSTSQRTARLVFGR